jgi:PAS domain-containing protein
MDDPQLELIETGPPDSATRFHLLLEALPFIAFVMSPAGQVKYHNQRMVDDLGFCPGADPPARDALPHPARSQLIAARQGAIATTSEYSVEARLQRHDGATAGTGSTTSPFSEPVSCRPGWLPRSTYRRRARE